MQTDASSGALPLAKSLDPETPVEELTAQLAAESSELELNERHAEQNDTTLVKLVNKIIIDPHAGEVAIGRARRPVEATAWLLAVRCRGRACYDRVAQINPTWRIKRHAATAGRARAASAPSSANVAFKVVSARLKRVTAMA